VQGRLFAAASESVALANLGFSDIRHLEPGTMAVIRNGRLRFERFARPRRRAHCFFEWVYFANVGSVIDGTSVYVSRSRAGGRLAEREDQPVGDDCIVVPVPDTAKAAADAFAYRLGIPSVEGLIRNRYVGRTFILGRDTRVVSARRKYTPLPAVLGGKRVFLVEDSIVRSTTLAALADQIRHRGGAREIHVRVACPPIISPCFYGIDMSTLGELFAPPYLPPGYRGTLDKKTAARMARKLGVDSLRYLAVDDLPRCICPSTGSGRHQGGRGRGEPVEARAELGGLCTGCVLGQYPTEWGNKLLARAKRKYRHGTDDARTYE
jgi:amidophosphoribosyltransferase